MQQFEKIYFSCINKILENKKIAMNISNISNISSNDSSEIGGPVFFLTYISEYLPYVTLVSIGSIIGIIGNSHIINKYIIVIINILGFWKID